MSRLEFSNPRKLSLHWNTTSAQSGVAERAAFAVGMPLTGAPLREEVYFFLDAGNACTSGVVVALFSFRRRLARVETGELTSVRQRARATTSSGTSLAVRHRTRAALFQEWCHHHSLPHSPRKALSDLQIQSLIRISSLFSAYLPASVRSFVSACRSLLLHRKSSQRGHRGHRESRRFPQAPSTLSIPASRTVEGPRLHHVWRDELHTFVTDKLPEEF